jgi:RNA polymerase sigma factor (sigma-70 family)
MDETSDAPDASLVARVLADDDRGAFAALVNRHQPAVRGLLRRLAGGDAALADDLAQETFVRVYRGLRGFRGGARLGTWLHRVAYNVFLSHVARRGDAAPSGRPGEGEDSGAPEGLGAATEAAALRTDVERAMISLRPAEAAALTLSYVEHLSHQEIGEVLGCPAGTVKTHIARGKERLRELLGDWGAQRGAAS